MSYEHLSDEDKVMEAIRFVARGAAIPWQLKEFLIQEKLYDLIVNPVEITNEYSQGSSGGHQSCVSRETKEDVSRSTDQVEAG